LRGSHRDLTEAPLGRAIFVLAVPMVLEMVMESVFAVTDIFFVGRLGAEAQATVGLTETMETMVYALAFGLSIGATSLVARRMGEKDEESAARTAVQAIALGLFFGIPLSAAGAIFAPELLRAMGGSPWVLEHGVHFTRVLLGANVSVCLLFLINAIFRGAGDAATAMRVLWLANGINIVLGPCLVFGVGPFPKLGVAGAAVATSIGRTSGVIYQLYRLTRGDGRLTVRWRHVRLEARTLLSVLRLSGAGTLQTVVGMTSWIVLVWIISHFGSQAVAGYTIAIRLVIFAILPSFGLATPRRRSSARISGRRSRTVPSGRHGPPEASARSSSGPSASSSSPPHRTSSASSPMTRWCSGTASGACESSPRGSPSTRTA